MTYNPYYSPKELGLEMLAFDQPDLSYEYDTLCFWANEAGQVFTARDSGCSCPTPFEDYEGETQEEVTQKLERVSGTIDADNTLRFWNKDTYTNSKKMGGDDVHRTLSDWMALHFKP